MDISSTDDSQITTLAFYSSVEPDTTFKNAMLSTNQAMLKTMYYLKFKKKEIQRQIRESETLKKQLDTAKVYVLISDTLYRLQRDYLKAKFSKATKAPPDFAFLEAWPHEIKITEGSGRFNLNNLVLKYKYAYILKSKFRKPPGVSFISGVFCMSAIFYNTRKDKAFVYAQFVCGENCGEGKDLFFKKDHGKWRVVLNKSDWVS